MHFLICWWIQEGFLIGGGGIYMMQTEFLWVVFQILLHYRRGEFFLIQKNLNHSHQFPRHPGGILELLNQ